MMLMRALLIGMIVSLSACSHAERSATTPAPKANYIASTNIETEAAAGAEWLCRHYHAEPAVLADRTGTRWRFECSSPPTWPSTMLKDVF
jgi:hypothetical protein